MNVYKQNLVYTLCVNETQSNKKIMQINVNIIVLYIYLHCIRDGEKLCRGATFQGLEISTENEGLLIVPFFMPRNPPIIRLKKEVYVKFSKY